MLSRTFILDSLERALKTVAQTVLALITMDGVDILNLDWKQVLSSAVTAGVISILTSVVSSSVGDKDSASLVESVQASDGTSPKG